MDNPGAVILKLASKYKAYMVKLRRELHQYPETALKEFRTQKTIAAMLKKVGCKVNTKIWKTAVAGTLEGKGKGKTAGIRADQCFQHVVEVLRKLGSPMFQPETRLNP